MTMTIQSILSTFDNGKGIGNTAQDRRLDASEVEAAGGFTALANAIEQLVDPADARRVANMLAPGSARTRLAEALAPRLAARGMMQDGVVRADAVFGRRAEYKALVDQLSPQANSVLDESQVTSAYMAASGEVANARVYNLSMSRVAANPTYWLTAAHAAPSPEARTDLFQRAIAAANAPGARNATVAYARYAAAASATTDAQRAQVLSMPKPGMNAPLERRWLEATALASRDDAAIRAVHVQAMRGFNDASGASEQLQYLSAASTTLTQSAEVTSVAAKALEIYTANRESNPKLAYAALRLVVRTTPESGRAQYVQAAEAAFARDPKSADPTLRQLLIAYGSPATRGDIVAGAVMAFGTPEGPRKDQVLSLATAVSQDFDHFY